MVTHARTAASFFLVLAFAGALAIFSSTLAKTPVLPLFAQAIGASPWQTGWIVMASTIPGILISFPAGVLADRFGQRRLLLASMLIFATAPWLYLVVDTAWSLAAVRFYHGFATAIFGTVASATIARNFNADRAARLSTFSSATIVGRSIAPFLGGALLSFTSIDSVYLVCALSGALALAAGFGLRMPEAGDRRTYPAAEAHTGLRVALQRMLADRRIVAVSLTEAAQYLSFGAVEAFLTLYAAAHGLPVWQIGIILGAQLISIIFVKPLMGGLSDRVGRGRVILPGLLLGAVSLLILPLAKSFPAMTLISVFYGIGFATVTSSTSALVADLTRDGAYGSSMGVLRTVMDVGQSIGPVLTGWVVGQYGYGSAFTLLAIILLSAALLFGSVYGRITQVKS